MSLGRRDRDRQGLGRDALNVVKTVESYVEVARNVDWVDEGRDAVKSISKLVEERRRHGFRSRSVDQKDDAR